MSKPTAELSDHTMAVLLSQEVATLTTKLEAAEADYKKLLKRDTDNLNKLIKAEKHIKALEAELEVADGGTQKLIRTVLKQQKLVTEAKATITALKADIRSGAAFATDYLDEPLSKEQE